MPKRPGLITGDLQAEIMRAMWKLERATVEQVRAALPRRRRGAYTTIQTVLNRLAERGLLGRERERNAIVYVTAVDEAEYVSGTLADALAGVSPDARRVALAELVGGMEDSELAEIRALGRELARDRRER